MDRRTKQFPYFILIVGLLLINAIGNNKSDQDQAVRDRLVKIAEQQLGKKYKHGGKGHSGFDCSGLVHFVFKHEQITLTGSSSSIQKQGKNIKQSQAKKGDLVFFEKNGRIFHVAIISANKNDQLWVVHSTSSKRVRQDDILASSYWRPKIHSFKDVILDTEQ